MSIALIQRVWQDSLADGRHRGTSILPVSNSTGVEFHGLEARATRLPHTNRPNPDYSS